MIAKHCSVAKLPELRLDTKSCGPEFHKCIMDSCVKKCFFWSAKSIAPHLLHSSVVILHPYMASEDKPV